MALEYMKPNDVGRLWTSALKDGFCTNDELAEKVVALQVGMAVLCDDMDEMIGAHEAEDLGSELGAQMSINETLREALKAERDRSDRLLRNVQERDLTMAARDEEIRRLKDQIAGLQTDARLNSRFTPDVERPTIGPGNGTRWSHRSTLVILTSEKGVIKLVLEVVQGVMNLAAYDYNTNGMLYSTPLEFVFVSAEKMLEKPADQEKR